MQVEAVAQDKRGITEIGKSRRKEKLQEKIKSAERIMIQLRQKLIRRYPVLSYAFHYMQFVPVEERISLETDGRHIFYSPVVVLEKAKQRQIQDLEYVCMHIIVHGLLGHFEIACQYERSCVMHTLMDMEVRKFIGKLEPEIIYAPLMSNSIYMQELMRDSRGLKTIYKEIDQSADKKKQLLRFRKDLAYDDHQVWYRNNRYKTLIDLKDMLDGNDLQKEEDKESTVRVWARIRSEMFGRNSLGTDQIRNSLIRNRDGRTNDKIWGTDEGEEELVVTATDRNTLNYRMMLKRFLKNREKNRENVDSLDKVLYAWGFDTYGDVAFIEPDTESERPSMNTIVVAIDTSGSCEGEIMNRFLSETKRLFSDIGTSDATKIVVIQCDARIQKLDVYRRTADLPGAETFSNGMTMYGFGETDFVPVFDYTDGLVENGEKVDCLIYLTDGYGTFPDKKDRAYETFFVLDISDESDIFGIGENLDFIPGWIHKVYMNV